MEAQNNLIETDTRLLNYFSSTIETMKANDTIYQVLLKYSRVINVDAEERRGEILQALELREKEFEEKMQVSDEFKKLEEEVKQGILTIREEEIK